MQWFKAVLIAALALGASAGPSQAQAYYFGGRSTTPYVTNPYVVNPYLVNPFGVNPYLTSYVPPTYGYGVYASPYGYRSFYNYGVAPAPWGYNTFYNYGTYVRPTVPGPFRSAYFDPYSNTYRFGPGYLNAPRFYLYSGY